MNSTIDSPPLALHICLLYLKLYMVDFGTKGIWTGLIAGISLQTIILVVITWRTDWEKEVSVAIVCMPA